MYQLVNGKKPVEPPWNGTLLSNAKEQITDTGNNMDESQNHNHKWKKTATPRDILNINVLNYNIPEMHN